VFPNPSAAAGGFPGGSPDARQNRVQRAAQGRGGIFSSGLSVLGFGCGSTPAPTMQPPAGDGFVPEPAQYCGRDHSPSATGELFGDLHPDGRGASPAATFTSRSCPRRQQRLHVSCAFSRGRSVTTGISRACPAFARWWGRPTPCARGPPPARRRALESALVTARSGHERQRPDCPARGPTAPAGVVGAGTRPATRVFPGGASPDGSGGDGSRSDPGAIPNANVFSGATCHRDTEFSPCGGSRSLAVRAPSVSCSMSAKYAQTGACWAQGRRSSTTAIHLLCPAVAGDLSNRVFTVGAPILPAASPT
jgi:hypothetical protein